MKKLVVIRRCSQGAFLTLFLFLSLFPFNHILTAGIFSSIDPLLSISLSIVKKTLEPILIISLGMIFLVFLSGRFFCGWMCPLGTLIDVAGMRLSKKRIIKKKTNRSRYIKFFVLAGVLVSAGLGGWMVWFFDPLVIVDRFLLFFKGAQREAFPVMITLVLFLSTFVTARLVPRFWCRNICPLGAIYAAVSKFSLLTRRVVPTCQSCNICESTCRMGAITRGANYIKGECILCMDCVYDCPDNKTDFVWKPKKNPSN
ncbi:MAG: 4Fe-4S binding protein [Candidatus Omnitrophica bacterium]|nr:4Fe-4S binding protein [Candidatus Omnitrophota bacterium]